MKPLLVAGIGNIFHGDDGFGVAVARELAKSAPHALIDVVDFGIRGLDLAYALTSGCRKALLIDTVQRGGAPGTLYLIEPEVAAPDESDLSPHQVDPASVLRLARIIGGDCAEVMLLGCEPETFGDPDEGLMSLSAAVAAAIAPAAAMASDLLAHWIRDTTPARAGNHPEELVP